MPANLKTQQWPQNRKRSVFIPIPKKGNAKEWENYHTIALISRTSKVMLKILQARLQQYVNCEIPDVQAGFRKGRGTRDQIANIRRIMEKASPELGSLSSVPLSLPECRGNFYGSSHLSPNYSNNKSLFNLLHSVLYTFPQITVFFWDGNSDFIS